MTKDSLPTTSGVDTNISMKWNVKIVKDEVYILSPYMGESTLKKVQSKPCMYKF